MELQEGAGWGTIIICASERSVLSLLLCLGCYRALGWCFETRHAGPSPSFSEKCVRVVLSGLPVLRRTLSGEVKEWDIIQGAALCLSVPSFVGRFVSPRRVSRLSNVALLIFCDTHTDTLRDNVAKVRSTVSSHAPLEVFKSTHCFKLTSSKG